MRKYILALGFSLLAGGCSGDLEKKVDGHQNSRVKDNSQSAGAVTYVKDYRCEVMAGFGKLELVYNHLKEKLTKVDLLNTPVRRNYDRAEQQFKLALEFKKKNCSVPCNSALTIRLVSNAITTMTEANILKKELKAIVLSGYNK